MWTLRPARAGELPALVAIDDDACQLFPEAGRDVELPPHHPFVVADQARWKASLEADRVVVAVTAEDEPVGFAALGFVDAQGHLQQLSVRRAWMRRGLGTALVQCALDWAEDRLWLTTYADLAWNAPFYERLGFVRVDEESCGSDLRAILDEERRVLPAPEQRVAMVGRGRRDRGSTTGHRRLT